MVKRGEIDYARYEARRRNIIAMLRAVMWQEVLHRVQISRGAVDPYEVGKSIHGWVETAVENAIEEGFLVKLAWEPSEGQQAPTEEEIQRAYFQVCEEVRSDVD